MLQHPQGRDVVSLSSRIRSEPGAPTPERHLTYHVFLASPGDVQEERRLVRQFFTNFNETDAHRRGLNFLVVDWENYSTAGVGRPQELITEQTLDRFDDSLVLVVGIMGRRFGSSSGNYESGTEEEFEWALKRVRERGFPEIKWFFKSDGAVADDRSEHRDGLGQWRKVQAFRRRLEDEHAVHFRTYESVDKFREIFDKDLRIWLNAPDRPWYSEPAAPVRPGVVVAGAVVATELLGFAASRAFEVILRIDRDFAAGPAAYFAVGAQALLPFLVYWFIAAVGVLLVVMLWWLCRSRLETVCLPWKGWLRSLNPVALATVVFLLGAGCWLATTWAFFDIFTALSALHDGSHVSSADLSILSPPSRGVLMAHGKYSACLSFILVLLVWQAFPWLERRNTNGSAVRLVKWATVVLAFLVLATTMLSRRIAWESFEVVWLDGQESLVIATSSDELLLYAAGAAHSPHRRIRRDAPGLRRTGTTRVLLDVQSN
jgi:hypothetical protein